MTLRGGGGGGGGLSVIVTLTVGNMICESPLRRKHGFSAILKFSAERAGYKIVVT